MDATQDIVEAPEDLRGLHPYRLCQHGSHPANGLGLCCCGQPLHHGRHDYRPTSITEVESITRHVNLRGCLEARYGGDLDTLPCQCEGF